MPESKPCAFCDYLSGKRPYTVLWRDIGIAVLVTREQRGVSHLLVLPLRHVPSLLDLRNEEAADLMIGVRDAAATIAAATKSPGLAVWQNNGLPAHQKIGHLHFHVAGTLPEGGTNFGDVPELSLLETDRIAEELAPHLGPRRRVN